MEKLSAELKAGLARLRRQYVDSAEELLRIIDADQDYPFDFVLFRVTGYGGGADEQGQEKLEGKALRSDLLQLMLDVCDSTDLRTSDFDEPVYSTDELAEKYHVSTKTIQRWRDRGLPARRLIFPDGKRRVAFLESSVRWFTKDRQRQIDRSVRFSQMADEERDRIIRWARRLVGVRHYCLSEVSKRLAKRTGRAVETVRYTIRRHDQEHPDDAIFPELSGALSDRDKMTLYRAFVNGTPVATLARRFQRTRGSIYRVVNEMRAMQLLDRVIGFVYNPQFDLPNADEIVLGDDGVDGGEVRSPAPVSSGGARDLPPYLRSLYTVPLLTPDQERRLFRRYNYLKFKADKLRRGIDRNRIRTRQLQEVERLLLQANVVKNRITRANLRLVVSIAKKHVGGAQTLFELISDGNVSLIRAVEKFDYARGNRFSTYASWAIMRNFARSVPKEKYRRDHFTTGTDEVLDIAAGMQSYEADEVNIGELRESIDAVLTQLSPTEQSILVGHFGLDEKRDSKTLEQLGKRLGLSKERVRQIEIRALEKLRAVLYPQKSELLG
ncbi:MAG: sigma-70 family RNA polymerase sigma factor [Planctomycetota bacterium]|jgi:RNA polymerase sigma factor (sigma-70 family)